MVNGLRRSRLAIRLDRAVTLMCAVAISQFLAARNLLLWLEVFSTVEFTFSPPHWEALILAAPFFPQARALKPTAL